MLRSLVLAAALGLAAVGCSDDGGSADGTAAGGPTSTTTSTAAVDETTVAEVPALGTYEVAETRDTWVDTSRPTAAHGGQPALPERTLDVVVYAPDGEPGPWPLIVFGHGSSRAGDHYEGTLRAWASAGYVVVAPDFPLSSEGTPGGTKLDDVEAQTADISFLIDTALVDLGDIVDPERIGIGGQSLGAITALGAGFNACCADPRIDVVTEFAGIWFPLSGVAQDPSTTDRPLLMVHGGADDSLTSLDAALEAWEDTIDAPGGFITLTGALHDDGYDEGPVDGWGTVVTEASLAFYDAHLKDDPDGWERVEAAVAAAGPEIATLRER